MAKGPINDNEISEYNNSGFGLIREMLNSKEVNLLERAAREDRVLDEHSFKKGDGEGGTVRLSL